MRTRTIPIFLTGLLTTALLLAGCAHRDTLVGTWSGTATTARGATAASTLTFTADGGETLATQISQGSKNIALSGSGTYTVSGTSLTQTMKTIRLNGQTVPLRPQSIHSETDQFHLDGNTLTLTKPGSSVPLVMTRRQ